MKLKRQVRDINLIAQTKRYINLKSRVTTSNKIYSRKKLKLNKKYLFDD